MIALSSQLIAILSAALQQEEAGSLASPLKSLFDWVSRLARTDTEKKTWQAFVDAPGNAIAKRNVQSWLTQKLSSLTQLASQAVALLAAARRFTAPPVRPLKGTLRKAPAFPPGGTGLPNMGALRGVWPPAPRKTALTAAKKGGASKGAGRGATSWGGASKKGVSKKGASKKAAVRLPATASKDTTVHCQMKAEMPSQVVVNQPAVLAVTLSRKKLQRIAAGMTGGNTAFAADPRRKITLRLHVLAHAEIAGDNQQKVILPAAGQEKAAYFTVIPRHVGTVELLLEVLQGQVLLGSLKLTPTCVRRAPEVAPPMSLTMEATSAKPYPERINRLTIREKKMGSQLFYEFDFDAPHYGVYNTYLSAPIRGNRQAYIRRLYKNIEDLASRSAGDAEQFLNLLKDWGATLSAELLPTALGSVLYEHRKELDSIQIVSTEPFIPWELLVVKDPNNNGRNPADPFLAEMGVVRWLFGWAPARTLTLRKGRARYVIPRYSDPRAALPQTAAEETFLKTRLTATSIAPDPVKIMNLLRKKNSFDLLHLACHGEAVSANILDANLILEEKGSGRQRSYTYLTQASVDQCSDFTDKEGPLRPLVVVNACQTGRQGIRLTQVGGFANAFLQHGAGLFVGALWSIGDTSARVFVETFYAGLLKGWPLAKAATKARQAAREQNPLDPTWLAYVVYGDPYAKLVTT